MDATGLKRNLPGSTSPNASRISQRRRVVPTIPDESTNPPICDETVVKAQAGRDECGTRTSLDKENSSPNVSRRAFRLNAFLKGSLNTQRPGLSQSSGAVENKERMGDHSSRDGIRPGALATIVQKRMASRQNMDSTGVGGKNSVIHKDTTKLTPSERRFLHTDFASTPLQTGFPVKNLNPGTPSGGPNSVEPRTSFRDIQSSAGLQGIPTARDLDYNNRTPGKNQPKANDGGQSGLFLTPGQSTQERFKSSAGDKGKEVSFVTPGQSTQERFMSSGVTYQSPYSSLLTRSRSPREMIPLFQLPASRIRGRQHYKSSSRYSGFHGKGNMGPASCDEKGSGNAACRLGSATASSLRSDQEDITVIVPECEDMGIQRPVWYQGARNLMPSLDAASHTVLRSSVTGNVPDISKEASSNGAPEQFENVHMGDLESEQFPETAGDEGTVIGNATMNAEDELIRGEYVNEDDDDNIRAKPDMWSGYMDLGPPNRICKRCNSVMWNEERNNKKGKKDSPTFSLCCRDGQVVLDKEMQPPTVLSNLLGGNEKSKHFMKNIRAYNAMFQFTSLGGKVDNRLNNGKAPWCFKLYGQNHHLLGTLAPMAGQQPKFCQLYIYDTESEVENRINAVNGRDQLDPEIVQALLQMLDENNKIARGFRMARDRFKLGEQEDFRLQLIHSRSVSGRTNHVICSNDVAALIVGDAEECSPFRDIIVETKQRYLKRVFETCSQFMAMQYPLLFPFGSEGFHPDIPLKRKESSVPVVEVSDELPDENKNRTTMSMREYYAYKLMVRPNDGT